jgi:hypothetical protein
VVKVFLQQMEELVVRTLVTAAATVVKAELVALTAVVAAVLVDTLVKAEMAALAAV